MTIPNTERYQLIKCLGHGSLGTAYLCRHLELEDTLVVMKVLDEELSKDVKQVTKCQDEIVATYSISHPNVVRAYEWFRDGDVAAYTMEFIDGGTLADRLNGEFTIGLDESIELLKQIASGLAAIHNAGVLHGNIKPENILMTSEGVPKLCDMGFSNAQQTEEGGTISSADYVSPEYLDSSHFDQRSDLYAFGVLAYRLLTGRLPFIADNVVETMAMRVTTDATPVRDINSSCPLLLSEFVMKALARNPSARFQSAAELCDELDRAVEIGAIH